MKKRHSAFGIQHSGGALRGLLLLCLFFLSACGFSPVYGPHDNAATPVSQALGNVAIENIPDRHGQFLRNHLIDRMYASGRPASPNAHLFIKLEQRESDVALQKDATFSRRQISVQASYTLKNDIGKTLFSGTARSTVNTNIFEAQYGTLASSRDAYARALREVGEQIVNRLSLYFAEKSKSRGPDYPSFLVPQTPDAE